MTFHYYLEVVSSQLTFTPSFFRGLGIPPTRNIFLVLLKIHEHPHVPKVLVNSPKSSTRKPSHPGMGGSAETPTSHSAGGQSQGTEESNVASGGGLWVIWLDDELDSHC